MKLTLLLAGLTMLLASPAFAQGSALGITGSPHDFADDVVAGTATPGFEIGGWNGREEICRVCHVPHDHDRANGYGLNGLLWNHEVSSATYTLYSSPTMNATVGQPDGHSKMCLGCHDGTVGIDTFDKYAGGLVFISNYNAGFQVPGGVNWANNLSATHPLSIVYDNVADPGLHDPLTTPMGNVAGAVIDDYLEAGKVQCSTCHDVHDAPVESVAGTHLLRANMKASTGVASQLCLTCHDK